MLINEIKNGEEYFIIEPGVLRFGNIDIIDKFVENDSIKTFDDKVTGSLYLSLKREMSQDINKEESKYIKIYLDLRIGYSLKSDQTKGAERYEFLRELDEKMYDLQMITSDDIIKVLNITNPEKDNNWRFYLKEGNGFIEMKQHIDTILKTILL